MICESRSNFMPQYTKCACQAISSPDTSLKFDVPPPFFFFCLFFIILPLIQCTDSCQTCIHRQYVFGLFLPFLFLFFFCLPNSEDCEPAVWRHLISCVCLLLCWATKDDVHYKLFIVFKEMCYWTALHAGHVWFFCFVFLYVLEDVLFVGWLQHGIHTSFMNSSLFWDSNKKVTRLPHPL